MSDMQFQDNVNKTVVPVTDSIYSRIVALDVNITLKHLLNLMRDADGQKRTVFYGQTLGPSDFAEYESLKLVADRLHVLPDESHSSAKAVFAKHITPETIASLVPDVRQNLDRMLNRYHSILGVLSEVAELAIIDCMVLQECLTQMTVCHNLDEFYEIVEDIKSSVVHTRHAVDPDHAKETKSEEAIQFEEIADALFYLAQHLSTAVKPDVSLRDLCNAVIAKLQVRYPEKFDTSLSANSARDRAAEMNAFYGEIEKGRERNAIYIANQRAFDESTGQGQDQGPIALTPEVEVSPEVVEPS